MRIDSDSGTGGHTTKGSDPFVTSDAEENG